jgi:hypothetical protein
MAISGRPRREALAREVERLQENAAARTNGRGFAIEAHWDDGGDEVEFLYRPEQLICDGDDLEDVLSSLRELGVPDPEVEDGPVGLKILHLPGRDVVRLVEDLAERLSDENMVALNHVLDAQGYAAMCPATEPVPWKGPVVTWPEPVGPRRVRLAVVDTGFSKEARDDSGFGRFSAVTSYEPDDEVFVSGTKDVKPYGGHGTAATAVALAASGSGSVAVEVRDCLVGGAVDEIGIVQDLDTVINAGVDVISVQAGLYTRAGLRPKSFEALHRRVIRFNKSTVIFAAAGNEASDKPFWPAAFPWVTAVGALTKGGDARTYWTNFGHWVDVYATGENVVVPFPNGRYEYLDGTSAQVTHGHALWSGTSFATPLVAGAVCRRMVERGVDAQVARRQVLEDAAEAALPSTGPRVIF